MSSGPVLVRIELEFENGKIVRLTGSEAEKWMLAVNSQTALSFAHGREFPKLAWQEVKPPKP